MTKEKMKQCADCIKQIKIAKKFETFTPKLKLFFLREFDVDDTDLIEYENLFKK